MNNTLKIALATPVIAVSILGASAPAYARDGNSVSATTVALNDKVTTKINTPITIPILTNDILAEGTTLAKITLSNNGESFLGTYALNPDNTVTFTPRQGVCAFSAGGSYGNVEAVPSDTTEFTTLPDEGGFYQITDSNGNSSIASMEAAVPCPDPGPAVDDTFTTEYNKPVDIYPATNDKLPPEVSSWKKILLPEAPWGSNTLMVEQGTFTVDGLKVTFTPKDGYHGPVPAVNYVIVDSNNRSTGARISGVVKDPTATGVDDHAATKQDTPVSLDVLSNDEANPGKIEGNSLTIYGSGMAPQDDIRVEGGVFTVKDGKLLFTPDKGFHGESGKVLYGAGTTDGVTYTAQASVTVEEAPVVVTPPSKPTDPTTTPTKPTDPTTPGTGTTPPSKPGTSTTTTPGQGNNKPSTGSNGSNTPTTPGPVIQTDMVDGGSSTSMGATGLGTLGVLAGAGALGALRRRK